ncbi:DNA replication complex subunit Gins51 [Halorubrum lipolyticum]|uniref:Gins51 C-terminal domain-containing protein n=1 Tax=Halorubrum lipolyticum DSM 21995 TaxID=1227482 RepID=M0NKE8_9EURY|nr:hypothetical protein [Halorubrum lipolyticum]EMA58316.1 hypothetical protein C469_13940 [Halorubrum lipolyticum DSM 21995]
MNLDELRSAQAKERRKDSLQHLRDSFYDDVAAYVADLRAARDRRAEQVDKPFSDDDVRRMSDEVETAEEVAEALYERRVGKVVKLASFAAADMSVDADGMTAEERQLFDDLVDRIGQNKSRVLDVLAGEAPPTPADEAAPPSPSPPTNESAAADPAPPAPDPEPPVETPPRGDDGAANTGEAEEAGETGVSGDALAGAMGGPDGEVADALDASTDATTDGGSRAADGPTADGDATASDGPTPVPPEPAPPGAPGASGADSDGDSDTPAGDDAPAVDGATANAPDRATVRITRDVGSIFGVDEREYDLANEDVVTLPDENAEPLVQRDAAERLD